MSKLFRKGSLALLIATLGSSLLLTNSYVYADDISVDASNEVEEVKASSKPVINKLTGEENKDGSVTFTVDATGGEDVGNGLLFYKFFEVDDNGKKKDINQDEGIGRNYSLDNTYKSEGTSSGNHKIYVEVQNSNNETVTDSLWYEENKGDEPSGDDKPSGDDEQKSLAINSLNVDGDKKVNSKLTIKADVTADDSDLNYKFTVTGPNGNEETIKDSSKSSVTWTPTEEGQYKFKVYVTDNYGNSKTKTKTITIAANEDDNPSEDQESLKVTLSKNNVNLVVGNTVKFTAKSTGGSGTVKYSFKVSGPSGADTSEYQTSKYYNLKLEDEGSYTVTVTAKDEAGNKVTSSKVSFSVKAPQSSDDDKKDDDSPTSDNKGIVVFLAALVSSIPYMALSRKKKNSK